MKELEDAVVELLDISEEFSHFSSAVQSVADRYQPGEEVSRLLIKIFYLFCDILPSNPFFLSPKSCSFKNVVG